MSTLGADLGDIAAGLIESSIGLTVILIALLRRRSRDLSLVSFGLILILGGLRWLAHAPTMRGLVGFPFTHPYFNTAATYAVVIVISAFLVEIFGPGLYNSTVWVFRSTIVYTAAMVGYELIHQGPPPEPSIHPAVAVLWVIVWLVNLVIMPRRESIALRVLRVLFLTAFIGPAMIDNLVVLRLFPWNVHLEQPVLVVLWLFGVGYIAAHLFFSNEAKLLAIEKEIDIARRIQLSNLPENLRAPPGLEIAARYFPMSAVAGDFYDIGIKDETGVGILIADVSGHGVGAALIGSMLKIAFASQAENLSDPARVLTQINRILQGKVEESFVTAFTLFIDVTKGTLRFAGAGHPPPLLWSPSKRKLERLSTGGTVLGPFPDTVYENADLTLEKDDWLVLYTDGIIETRNRAGELFGETRLGEFIETHALASAEGAADELMKHLATWSGKSVESPPDDDLTLIVMRLSAGPAAHPPT
jgi:serine phosphatase RsbU (regulator of sigma subunit)